MYLNVCKCICGSDITTMKNSNSTIFGISTVWTGEERNGNSDYIVQQYFYMKNFHIILEN